jgi:hypothetical protein
MRLYRAVSQPELDDIATSGGFRLDPDSFGFGKWFAFALEDAASWGRRFAGFDGLIYHVVEADVDNAAFSQFSVTESLDNIGPAVFVEDVHLPGLTVVTFRALFLDKSGPIVPVQLAPKALLGE